jgi:hypothetical protein
MRVPFEVVEENGREQHQVTEFERQSFEFENYFFPGESFRITLCKSKKLPRF